MKFYPHVSVALTKPKQPITGYLVRASRQERLELTVTNDLPFAVIPLLLVPGKSDLRLEPVAAGTKLIIRQLPELPESDAREFIRAGFLVPTDRIEEKVTIDFDVTQQLPLHYRFLRALNALTLKPQTFTVRVDTAN